MPGPPGQPQPRTATLPGAAYQAGLLRAPVIGLRVLGTTIEYQLPLQDHPFTIGAAEDRSIHLEHPSISRLHARIERQDHHLILIDCDSKNGCYADDERRAVIQLIPGGRIRLGELDLVAFSHQSDRVRRVFQRYLGYDDSALRAVEDAHHAATHGRHLILLGPPGAGAIACARSIHAHTGGPPWPLIYAGRLVPTAPGQHTAPHFRDSYAEQRQALEAAAHGTLVLSMADLPSSPSFVFDSIRRRAANVRALFLAAAESQLGELAALAHDCAVITVPALASRRHEIPQILADVMAERASASSDPPPSITPHDHERLLAHDWPRNHDELVEVVERLIALRTHGRIRPAARALGMSPGSFSEWAKKYGFRIERWPGRRRRR